MKRTVVLFTTSFPFGNSAEQTFLGNELPYLVDSFERVVVVPFLGEGEPSPVPKGAEVDDSFARETRAYGVVRYTHLLPGLFSPAFAAEINEAPMRVIHPNAMKRFLFFDQESHRARTWIRSFIDREKLDLPRALFYTYWCDIFTTACAMAKEEVKALALVSRVHGYDLYEERHQPPYIPRRRFTLDKLDRLFPISQHGADYLIKRYPEIAPRCEVAKLGTNDPGFVTPPPTAADGTFRVLSCSSLIPVKRVDLISAGVARMAERNNGRRFEWNHFGDGPERDRIEKQPLPPNVKAVLHGNVPNAQVMEFYRSTPVDCFVNASRSEGIPISIMEAQSCGLPVIAPAVGGIPEIVNDVNGRLLPPDPSPDVIASAMASITAEMRSASRRSWEERHNGASNYTRFAERLATLASPISTNS